jgi:anti-sigma28 factor (negative regulator of flagellin synthesis)
MSEIPPNDNNSNKPRRRGLTSVTLGWLADRMRKAEKLKAQISSGEYKIDNEKIAASILNKETQ